MLAEFYETGVFPDQPSPAYPTPSSLQKQGGATSSTASVQKPDADKVPVQTPGAAEAFVQEHKQDATVVPEKNVASPVCIPEPVCPTADLLKLDMTTQSDDENTRHASNLVTEARNIDDMLSSSSENFLLNNDETKNILKATTTVPLTNIVSPVVVAANTLLTTNCDNGGDCSSSETAANELQILTDDLCESVDMPIRACDGNMKPLGHLDDTSCSKMNERNTTRSTTTGILPYQEDKSNSGNTSCDPPLKDLNGSNSIEECLPDNNNSPRNSSDNLSKLKQHSSCSNNSNSTPTTSVTTATTSIGQPTSINTTNSTNDKSWSTNNSNSNSSNCCSNTKTSVSVSSKNLSTNDSSRDSTQSASPAPLYPETHRPELGKLLGATPLSHDPLEFVVRHLFYIVSSYLAYSTIAYAYSSLLHFCC